MVPYLINQPPFKAANKFFGQGKHSKPASCLKMFVHEKLNHFVDIVLAKVKRFCEGKGCSSIAKNRKLLLHSVYGSY